jgi:hypothetical protein
MAGQFVSIEANGAGTLYGLQGSAAPGSAGWTGFYVTGAGSPPTIEVAAAWTSYWAPPIGRINGGIYVAAPSAPAAGFLARLQSLVATLNQNAGNLAYRYVLWISDPDTAAGVAAAQALPFSPGGNSSSGSVAVQAAIKFGTIVLLVNVGAAIQSSDGISLRLVQFNNAITLNQWLGKPLQIGTVTGNAALALADPAQAAGTMAMPMTMTTSGVRDDLATLRTGISFSTELAGGYRKEFATALAKETLQRGFTMAVSLNPLYPTDPSITAFRFTGLSTGKGAPRFSGGFYTDFGKRLLLEPKIGQAALVLQPDKSLRVADNVLIDSYYAAPAGSFYLRLADSPDAAPGGEVHLVCGLSPVETVGIVPSGSTPGDLLVFYPGQPAFAPLYPLPAVNLSDPDSPLGEAPLLDDRFTTSYATVVRAPVADGGATAPNSYYAQGQGAPLYASGSSVPPDRQFISGFFLTPAAAVADSGPATSFPIMPYLGIAPGGGPYDLPSGEIGPFEAAIIAPFRKQRIFLHQTISGALARPARSTVGVGDPIPTTTPQGLLATIAGAGDPRWLSLLLATNSDAGINYRLQFRDVDAVLQSAFQTNQQFLVVTQPAQPWELNQPGSGTKTVFDNVMSIAGWPFEINVGVGNVPGDYRNVMIFKFAKGALSDLVKSPAGWTNAAQFNASDNMQLALVSQWLQDYIQEARTMAAAAGSGDFLDNFLAIVDDPGWNGILMLKADVLLQSFPPEIKGLITGIRLDQFFAHHIGVNVNFVTNASGKIEVAGNSSLFGLIDYTDPAYAAWIAAEGDPDVPVAPQPGLYDFTVLTLKVLFENSSIRDFQSRVQVTLNSWFGDEVAETPGSAQATTAPQSNSILLDGAYEEHGGASTFTFSGTRERLFTLGSNVLGAVDVVKAEFQTLSAAAGGSADSVESRFVFTGYMNFRPVPGFDLYSFGSDWAADVPEPGQGLYFSNLYLHMGFDLAAPTVRRFAFDAGQITFNTQLSRARPASLYPNFPLSVGGLVQGAADQKPNTLGYLPVGLGDSTAPLTGLGDSWHGLACTLDFGTAGELAGQAGLVAALLLAWSPGSGRKGDTVAGSVSLKLPGAGGGEAKLLSLQGVFKLSIGDIELLIGETDTGGQAYLLKLTQIALKFFGISFPPSGNTVVFLFGDPAKSGSASKIGWYAAYNKSTTQALGSPYALELPPVGEAAGGEGK